MRKKMKVCQILAASIISVLSLAAITAVSLGSIPLRSLVGLNAGDVLVVEVKNRPGGQRQLSETDVKVMRRLSDELLGGEDELPEEEPDEVPAWANFTMPREISLEMNEEKLREEEAKAALSLMEVEKPETELGIEYAKDPETILAEILMNIPPREVSFDDGPEDDEEYNSKRTGRVEDVPSTCNLVNGTWVKDKRILPYSGFSCRFIPNNWNCDKRDLSVKYQRWRWKPNSCELPWPFDVRGFLDLMRGKTMWIVGDPKVDRTFAYSLACMIEAEAKIEGRDDVLDGLQRDGMLFNVVEYGLKIRFVGVHWLVAWDDSDEAFKRLAVKKDSPSRVLVHTDQIDRRWFEHLDSSVDVLVLSASQKYDNIRDKRKYYTHNGVIVDWDWPRAYRTAMETVANALKENEKFRGVAVFKTYSPLHFPVGDPSKNPTCKSEDVALKGSEREAMRKGREISLAIDYDVFGNSKHVHLLDITQVSATREDGHTRLVEGKTTKKKPKVDCINWCIPGVPDTWTALLHIVLYRDPKLRSQKKSTEQMN